MRAVLSSRSFPAARKLLGLADAPSSRQRFRRLTANHERRGFAEALADAARAWLDRVGDPIDYAARRKALAQLTTVPAEFDLSESKRNLAAAWLWADLTSGDPALSPAASARAHHPKLRHYRFAVRHLASDPLFALLAPELREWGLESLSRR